VNLKERAAVVARAVEEDQPVRHRAEPGEDDGDDGADDTGEGEERRDGVGRRRVDLATHVRSPPSIVLDEGGSG
jgi:hypothetical protein